MEHRRIFGLTKLRPRAFLSVFVLADFIKFERTFFQRGYYFIQRSLAQIHGFTRF